MSEEYTKQCNDGHYGPRRPECPPPCDPCDNDRDNGWESWFPILILLFLFCGGFSGFGSGGNQCHDNCCDTNGGNWSWIVILIILFCFCSNGNGNDGRGGLFGGLF